MTSAAVQKNFCVRGSEVVLPRVVHSETAMPERRGGTRQP